MCQFLLCPSSFSFSSWSSLILLFSPVFVSFCHVVFRTSTEFLNITYQVIISVISDCGSLFHLGSYFIVKYLCYCSFEFEHPYQSITVTFSEDLLEFLCLLWHFYSLSLVGFYVFFHRFSSVLAVLGMSVFVVNTPESFWGTKLKFLSFFSSHFHQTTVRKTIRNVWFIESICHFRSCIVRPFMSHIKYSDLLFLIYLP